MSSAAQTISTVAQAETRVPAWKNLRGLLPYLARYKASTLLGLTFLVAGGLLGALLPLVMGAMIDSLSGSRARLIGLEALPGPVSRFLLSFYRPFSRETLLIYGATLLGVVAVKRALSFWTRSILIGVSRDI